jgi:hypothetical protein
MKELWYPDAHGASPRLHGHDSKVLGVFAMVLAPSATGKSHYVRHHRDAVDGDTIVAQIMGWPVSSQFTDADHFANWAAMAAVARFSNKPVLWNGKPFLSPALLLYAVLPPYDVWRRNADRRAELGRPGAWGTDDEHFAADSAAIQNLIDSGNVRRVFQSIEDAVEEAVTELAAQGVANG